MQLRLRCALPLALALSSPALGQNYSSGSDGSDGALTFPANAGVIQFDPTTFTPALDPDGDNVYHFTTITIPAGTTVRLSTRALREGAAVYWLASGAVTVAGTLDLNGENGHDFNATHSPSFAGAGGWSGGVGGSPGSMGTNGNGPGGGKSLADANGGGGGHLTAATGFGPGAAYGNDLLIPMWGGSGGGGGCLTGNGSQMPAGGGAGGGALVLASSVSITVTGQVQARGGNSGQVTNCAGGGGSGGALRLVAPTVDCPGTINVSGGSGFGSGGPGAPGRARVEAFKLPVTPTVLPIQSFTRGTPRAPLPPAGAPVIKVLRVAGVDVSMTPSGSFAVPDVAITSPGAATIELETRGIPAGTVLQLAFQPESGAQFSATSSAIVVNSGVGSATATATFPSGFTRVFVSATWTP